MTKTMQRILELVGFEQNESGEWTIELELDWEEGLKNYTFQAVKGFDSWTGNPRINIVLLEDEDWEPMSFSTFVEMFMS